MVARRTASSIFDRPVPVLRELLGLADNHPDAVVLEIKPLAGALDSVAYDGDGLVFQDLACFFHGEFVPHDDFFFGPAEIYECHGVPP
jgi:hypothetical protein